MLQSTRKCCQKNTISIISTTTTTKIKKKENKISKQGKYLGIKNDKCVCVLSYKSNRNEIRPKKKYLMFFFVECL